jgi:hypothetical protein
MQHALFCEMFGLAGKQQVRLDQSKISKTSSSASSATSKIRTARDFRLGLSRFEALLYFLA